VDAEAAVVRECVTRVLAGETLTSVCNDLNSRAIVTAAGGPWRTQTLKLTLTSARISGRGDILADHAWPPIITADASDQLRALLTRPERRTNAGVRTASLRAVEERRDELAADWAAGDISRKEWSTARRVLDDQVTKLTRQLSRSEHGRALAEFTAMDGDLRERWEHLGTGARRALAAAVADHITVSPARTRHWNPDRVKITWRA
jgi:hypothetical protein